MAVAIYCLQNANKIHCLQSVNTIYCLQNVNKMHCLQSVNSIYCLQNANKMHCLQTVNSMYCLQNANKMHCLQSVNSMYCLQNANKTHCLQSVDLMYCLQTIERISVTTVQQDLLSLCMCLLKTVLVASLLCWNVNKTVHSCSTLLRNTANDTAAAVYTVSNYMRSLTHDVCIIGRHASLHVTPPFLMCGRGHQHCSSDSRRYTLHAWTRFCMTTTHTHTHAHTGQP